MKVNFNWKNMIDSMFFIVYFLFTSMSTVLYTMYPNLNSVIPSYYIVFFIFLIFAITFVNRISRITIRMFIPTAIILLTIGSGLFNNITKSIAIGEIKSPSLWMTIILLLFLFYDNQIEKRIKQLKVIGIIVYIIYMIAYFNDIFTAVNLNYMTFGYGLILYWIVSAYFAFLNKKIYDILISIIIGISIFLIGNRGAVIVMGFTIIYFWKVFTSNKSKIMHIIILTIFLGCILLGVDSFRNTVNIQSSSEGYRNLELIMGKNFFASRRNIIYDNIILLIKTNPIRGYGVFSDEVLLNYGATAHNFILELILDFGIIVGTIMVLLILLLPFIYYKNQKESIKRIYFYMFYITGFVEMSLSGSIFRCLYFWISVVLVCKIKSQDKYKQRRRINDT